MKTLLSIMLVLTVLGNAHAQNYDTLPPASKENSAPTQGSTDTVQVAPAATPSDPNACVDDPRLNDIVTFMESTTIPNPKLTITPESFILLDAEVAKAMGGKMIVCPNNPVLKNGQTMKQIVVSFHTVMDKLTQSAIAGDFENIKNIVKSYKVAPMEPQEVITLLSPMELNEKTRKEFYEALGMRDPGEKKVSGLFYPIFDNYLQIFVKLGGRATKNVDVYVTNGSSAPSDLPEETLKVLSVEQNVRDPLKEQLRGAGLTPVN